MAWRYRDRITKSFVDTATYNRSRSHGGTKFERVSDAHWKSSGSVTRKTVDAGSKSNRAKSLAKGKLEETVKQSAKKSKPSDAPKTFRELQEATKAKAKRKMAGWYEDYDDGPEYETGVDY